jgi:hypothetical protein
MAAFGEAAVATKVDVPAATLVTYEHPGAGEPVLLLHSGPDRSA